MNNFRQIKNKTSNFTMIPNSIIRDNNLSLKARFLLIFMLQLPSDWTFNERGLASAIGEGRGSIRGALKELENHKYLYRVQTREKGNFGNMLYYLFEEPTEMLVDGKEVVKQNDQKMEQNQDVITSNVLNITKEHPDYDYLNGGWMLED